MRAFGNAALPKNKYEQQPQSRAHGAACDAGDQCGRTGAPQTPGESRGHERNCKAGCGGKQRWPAKRLEHSRYARDERGEKQS
jgi:hypothetical protein